MLQFVTLICFYFSFGYVIFDILPDFPANIFFLPYHVCKQFIWSLVQKKNSLFLMSKITALLVYHANCSTFRYSHCRLRRESA